MSKWTTHPYFIKLLIFKWANNPKYKGYSNEFNERFKNIKDIEDGRYLNSYYAAQELFQKLEESNVPTSL